MTDEISITVSCTSCGESLSSEWARESNSNNVCPKCGGSAKAINMGIQDTVDIRESLKAKLKDPSLPSHKNPRVEVFSGDDLRKSNGQWMKKNRVIDKRNDQYKEIVVDPKTGEVIHHNEEPLWEHYGHCSAKPKS